MNREHDMTPSATPRTIADAVRKFAISDAAAVEEILRSSPEAAAWTLNSLERLRLRGEIAWVTETQGAIAGFLVARTILQEAEILNLCVDPAKRRAGSATALLQTALAEFRRLRVTTAFLEVRESNSPAISFYVKHGFVKNGSRAGYYQDPTEAAVLMKRELTG